MSRRQSGSTPGCRRPVHCYSGQGTSPGGNVLFSDDNERPAPVQRTMTRRRIAGIVTTLAIIATIATVGGWALLNSRRVADQFTVWGFTPSAALLGYIDRASMTEEGEFLFLASTPTIASSAEFDEVCRSHQEDVGILGCYVPRGKTIHLFDVTDDRLDGIEEVVAAHEMLHAAWDRLGRAERDRLEPLLEAEAERRSGDTEFIERMDFYARSEPGQRSNELHSIIATEIADIAPALEAHYAQYFERRSDLVTLHVASNTVFVQLQERSEALVASLATLRAEIESDYADYNAGYDRLNADIQAFNRRADDGDFSSFATFDRERRALFVRQATLDALYASIQERTAQYDADVAELDTINAEVAELNASINIAPRTGEGM